MSPLRARLKDFGSLRGDPARLPDVLVDVLIVGFVVLLLTGAVEVIAIGDPGSLVQPVAAGLFIVVAIGMKLRARPRPVPLLVVSIALGLGYLLASAIDPTLGDVTDTAPVAVIVAAGVIALVAGGRRANGVGLYALVATGAAAATVQIGLSEPTVEVVIDAISSLVIMGIAFVMVRSVRTAMDDVAGRYRDLIESAPVAVVEVDLAAWTRGADVIRMGPMNPVAAGILGYTDGETGAMLARDSIPPAYAALLDTLASSPSGTTTVEPDRSDRAYKVGWAIDPGSGRVVLSGTDITAQLQAEAALTGKVSARDRFIASVSHELRTPLAGALGLLELVAEDGIAGRDRDEMVGLALNQVRDMVDIVEDLLVAARAADGHLTIKATDMDLSAAVQQVLAVTEAPFVVDIEPGIEVVGDPVRVRQIVKNLVTNAVRYGGDERTVLVRREGDRSIVEVRDSGPPLDVEFAARMFEPYQHATAARAESVGLGLTVARTLAGQMGGQLTYGHDGDVVFRLTLPAHRSGDAPI